jgi:bifunctional non-homologous end joining protein LigD
VRAEEQPTVSTPLGWDELTDDLSPLAFTIDTVLPRVRERGDLWAKGMRRPNSLEGIVARD